ncbi:MAG: acyloxyacyl hydrolase [Alistipes sp.]|nr:acyloxyacyl hydrolase [Alistipes sp.]
MARKVAIALIGIIALTLMGVGSATAATPIRCDSISHRFSVEVRPAYNIVSHYALRGDDPLNSAASLHLRYAFSFNDHSEIGKRFPTAYQGVGLAAYTFFHPEITGQPIALYILQGAHIADWEKITLGYEWNFGLSWHWTPNEAMNSKWNIMVNVALPVSWHISPKWELSLTPDFTHLSNGDTHFSNSGANLFGVRLGITRHFNDHGEHIRAKEYIKPSEELEDEDLKGHLSHDVVLYGGWRADRFVDHGEFVVIDRPLFLDGIQYHLLYHFNRHFAFGSSIDIQTDSSLNLHDAIFDENGTLISYEHPSLIQQTECGVSLRCEITSPLFAVGAGIGVNILGKGYDISRIYTQYSLKHFITSRMFIFVGYRFNSTQYTHNMMYGLGLRF